MGFWGLEVGGLGNAGVIGLVFLVRWGRWILLIVERVRWVGLEKIS